MLGPMPADDLRSRIHIFPTAYCHRQGGNYVLRMDQLDRDRRGGSNFKFKLYSNDGTYIGCLDDQLVGRGGYARALYCVTDVLFPLFPDMELTITHYPITRSEKSHTAVWSTEHIHSSMDKVLAWTSL